MERECPLEGAAMDQHNAECQTSTTTFNNTAELAYSLSFNYIYFQTMVSKVEVGKTLTFLYFFHLISCISLTLDWCLNLLGKMAQVTLGPGTFSWAGFCLLASWSAELATDRGDLQGNRKKEWLSTYVSSLFSVSCKGIYHPIFFFATFAVLLLQNSVCIQKGALPH